jgi:predicted amidohydrolase
VWVQNIHVSVAHAIQEAAAAREEMRLRAQPIPRGAVRDPFAAGAIATLSADALPLAEALALGTVDLIVVPSAFTYVTGQAHWEILLRARAIENQCYVLAPAQGGRHENGRRTWGDTMLIDPWGEILARLPEGEGVVAGTLSAARIAEVRGQLPALAHRTL